jgi:hypothetical protein
MVGPKSTKIPPNLINIKSFRDEQSVTLENINQVDISPEILDACSGKTSVCEHHGPKMWRD